MIHQGLGIAGVAMVLGAYFLLVSGRLRETDLVYLVLNVAGSALILVSLAYRFNLAATVMQVAWIVVTVGGTLLRKRSRKPVG